MTHDHSLHSLSKAYRELGRQVAVEASTSGALQAVTAVAARSVPGVDAASVTRRRSNVYETVSSTAEVALQGDTLQYQLRQGPCVDAVDKNNVFLCLDLTTDPRWPQFGPAAADSLGVHSLMSIRLALDDTDAMAGLNLYSRQRNAYDDDALHIAMLLATHAGVIVSGLIAHEKAANLEKALATSREIGMAMGVLMATHKITSRDAFDLLRFASQRTHRKLRDIAADVTDTGTLELP
jgi:GAF domain-containing protein